MPHPLRRSESADTPQLLANWVLDHAPNPTLCLRRMGDVPHHPEAISPTGLMSGGSPKVHWPSPVLPTKMARKRWSETLQRVDAQGDHLVPLPPLVRCPVSCTTCATHSLPALALRAHWNGDGCFLSPTTMPLTPPSSSRNAMRRPNF